MTQRRLRLILVLFFLALAIPTSILVYQAYGQLKWEAFYQHQRLARELSRRIDSGFRDLIEREEKRPISDYEFLNVTGSDDTAFLQRSPLSEFPRQADTPGLLGYFQVDASGRLRTPIVPAANASNYGISALELQQREQQEGRIRGILDQNRLVGKSDVAAAPLAVPTTESAPAPTLDRLQTKTEITPQLRTDSMLPMSESDGASSSIAMDDSDVQGQAAFDELTTRKQLAPAKSRALVDRVKDLQLEDRYEVESFAAPELQEMEVKTQAKAKRSRKEQVNLPRAVAEEVVSLESNTGASADAEIPASEPLLNQQAIRIQTFESEVEPMEFALLDSGHFVLFRRVWHQDERYVQAFCSTSPVSSSV